LGFVDQVKAVEVEEGVVRDMENYNTLRDDAQVHEAGESRDEILAGMPQVEDDYLVVSKVLPN